MRIFKSKWFVKFAKKEGIEDQQLIKAVADVESGKIDANYGGGVIKQRMARSGGGKSSGYRSIILYLKGDKAFFVFGFSKKDQENINSDEEAYFKKLAKVTLRMTDTEISAVLEEGTYVELGTNGED
jgi:hypothetical protein